MKTVTADWKEPVVRTDGHALPIAELRGTEVALSSDNGVTYAVLATVAPAATQTLVKDLVDGSYKMRLIAIDSTGQRGVPLIGDVVVKSAVPAAPTALNIVVS